MLDRAAARLTTPLQGRDQDGISDRAIYAYRDPGSGEPPIQIFTVTEEPSRPDVAAVYGSLFIGSGFSGLAGGLSPGVYDLAFFGRSVVSQEWSAPTVVRVAVQ